MSIPCERIRDTDPTLFLYPNFNAFVGNFEEQTNIFIIMKKVVLLFVAVMFVAITFAQTPQSFKYQAVARNAGGEFLTMQNVSLQISILQTEVGGTAVYVETHSIQTNEFGLINLEIGNGDLVSGDISTINWSADSYFVKIEMDATGGTNYEEMGTSQLLSVPYALHALTVTDEADPVFVAHPANNITDAGSGEVITEIERNKLNELSIIPVGTIFPFAAESSLVPEGWLLCDGTALNKNDNPEYADLFDIIGTNWGGSTGEDFQVPDLRGNFLRGADLGAGNDPDYADRTDGSDTEKIGSLQDDEFESHLHDHYIIGWGDGPEDLGHGRVDVNSPDTHWNDQTNNTGGNETRPVNAYVNYIIKY